MSSPDDIHERLSAAGARMRSDVQAHVDAFAPYDELVRPSRRFSLAQVTSGAAAAIAVAVAVTVVATSTPGIRVDDPLLAEGPGVAAVPESAGSEMTTLGGDTRASACSAAGMAAPDLDDAGLTTAAAATRHAIVDAAISCDYGRLVDLATFGEGNDPATSFVDLEAAGTPVLASLARLLPLAPHVDTTGEQPVYIWPVAHVDPDSGPLAELAEAFGPDQVDAWLGPDGTYDGPRLAVAADGTWRYYASAD